MLSCSPSLNNSFLLTETLHRPHSSEREKNGYLFIGSIVVLTVYKHVSEEKERKKYVNIIQQGHVTWKADFFHLWEWMMKQT